MNPKLERYLERARDFGALGPGSIGEHVRHAEAWAGGLEAEVLQKPFEGRFMDLGTGAGIPGLVFALRWPGAQGLLLDARGRRVRMLEEAVAELGLGERIEVVGRRAELEAREPTRRGAFDLVVARGFGPPAAAAECAAGFLEAGGRLSVSEPPDVDPTRWPAEPLRELGFGSASRVVHEGASFVILHREGDVSDRWPRRDGLPHRRPLW